jgi:hypothetical protein
MCQPDGARWLDVAGLTRIVMVQLLIAARMKTTTAAIAPSAPLHITLDEFQLSSPQPLSHRTAKGFFDRISKSTLRVEPRFLRDLRAYTR